MAKRDRKGHQQGAQSHAEGQQGEKTHRAFLEGRHTPPEEETLTAHPTREGRHRLEEDRQQHDEAEADSEQNRAAKNREPDR